MKLGSIALTVLPRMKFKLSFHIRVGWGRGSYAEWVQIALLDISYYRVAINYSN